MTLSSLKTSAPTNAASKNKLNAAHHSARALCGLARKRVSVSHLFSGTLLPCIAYQPPNSNIPSSSKCTQKNQNKRESWLIAMTQHGWRMFMKPMNNLYGKLLTKSTVHECGEIATVKLTFSEEPNRYVIRRIHLCEIRATSSGCLFPPTLRIVRGSVSGPDPVDVCTEYFQDVHKNTNSSYYCTVEGNGRYTLRCKGGDVAHKIANAVLEIQHCQGTKRPDQSSASAWYAVIGILGVVVFAIAVYLLCTFKQHIHFYYRVSPEEVTSDTVKYRA
ncbi:hypothetical protein MTO96_008442 [Rhipicephalus appendiculatus]